VAEQENKLNGKIIITDSSKDSSEDFAEPTSEEASGGVRETELQAEDPLEVAQKQAAENKDKWIRAVAELDNYKKRAIQERSNILKYKNEEVLRDMLPIVDNLSRALEHAPNKKDPVVEGVSMVLGMFKDVLSRYGVTEITALGNTFDPHKHEAIARVPAQDAEPNTIVEELEKGYQYQDRLLRPSKVVVATK
jgi:molecular chaperone GrpE